VTYQDKSDEWNLNVLDVDVSDTKLELSHQSYDGFHKVCRGQLRLPIHQDLLSGLRMLLQDRELRMLLWQVYSALFMYT
jgi:hypothetical protein